MLSDLCLRGLVFDALQNADDAVHAGFVAIFKGGFFNGREEIDIGLPVGFAFGLGDADVEHKFLNRAEFLIIKSAAQLIKAEMIHIQKVRGDQVVPRLLGSKGHPDGENDDVFLGHFVPAPKEVVDSLDLASEDPATENDGVIVLEVDLFEFSLFQRDSLGLESLGDLFGVFLRAAGVGFI